MGLNLKELSKKKMAIHNYSHFFNTSDSIQT
jgi:hypothetical protein